MLFSTDNKQKLSHESDPTGTGITIQDLPVYESNYGGNNGYNGYNNKSSNVRHNNLPVW